MSYTTTKLYEKVMNYFEKNHIGVKFQQEHDDKIANGKSYYDPIENSVMIPNQAMILGNNAEVNHSLYYLSTVCHEAVHSTAKLLGRNLQFSQNEIDKLAYEELVAEIGALTLVKKHVSETRFELLALKNITYMSCWAKRLDSNKLDVLIEKAIKDANEAVKLIERGTL